VGNCLRDDIASANGVRFLLCAVPSHPPQNGVEEEDGQKKPCMLSNVFSIAISAT
jgi:hypothetical protein